jgi:hypothetical protein
VAIAVGILASGRVGSWLRIHRIHAALLLVSVGVVIAGTLTPLADANVTPPVGARTCDLTRTWLATPMDFASGDDVAINVMMLMPLGFALGAMPFAGRKLGLVAGSVALPFAIEGLQLVLVVLGRGCQAADVVDNLTGLFIGLVAGLPISWLRSSRASI